VKPKLLSDKTLSLKLLHVNAQIIFPTFGWPDILPARPGIAGITTCYPYDLVLPEWPGHTWLACMIKSYLGESHENCSNNSKISPRMIGSYLYDQVLPARGLTWITGSYLCASVLRTRPLDRPSHSHTLTDNGSYSGDTA